MGLSVRLQDEQGIGLGAFVTDPTNVLHRLLERVAPGENSLLAGIDWYGDTIFNRQQLPRLLREWRALEKKAHSEEEMRVVAAVSDLIHQADEGVHLYVTFIGD